MKKLTQRQIEKLPKVRLRYGPAKTDYFECHYLPGWRNIDIPRDISDFKPNGVGLALACGNAASGMKNHTLFPHPAYYCRSIDSAFYVVCKLDDTGKPLLAVRYSQKEGEIQSVYDKSHQQPEYRTLLKAMLEEYPTLKLKKGRLDKRPAGKAHGTGGGQGPTKHRGLVGEARRMQRAKFIDKATVERVSAEINGRA